MSQENVEIVRAAIDGYNETGELPWELIDPGVEWVIDPSGNLAGPYHGHDGVSASLKQLDLLHAKQRVGDRRRATRCLQRRGFYRVSAQSGCPGFHADLRQFED